MHKATFPTRRTCSADFPNRTNIIKGVQILPFVFVQIDAKVVLELAVVAVLALAWREFWMCRTRRAEAPFIFRSSKLPSYILTSVLLFALFVILVLLFFHMSGAFGHIIIFVRSFGCRLVAIKGNQKPAQYFPSAINSIQVRITLECKTVNILWFDWRNTPLS